MNPHPITRTVFTTGIDALKINFDPHIDAEDLKQVIRNYKLAFAPVPARSTDPAPPPDEHRPINDPAWVRTVELLLLERPVAGMPRLAEVIVVFRRERERVLSDHNGQAFVADLEARRAARR